ncbi:hypothetical protein [Nocardiopsis alborubida]|uniref:Uncharacterized protein n=1 Tax=Nocardiopsis alborubida TaxID=146802 RepID=A0A7X6MHJ2_9ACTN|nr:hypothetical protein [Nocardiopsis alborubida]NKZ01473.1 hypothetical protein [Nocardiopsis alborubida]
MEIALGVLFMFLLAFGGWIVWGIGQGFQNAHERALAREREETKRLQLRLESQERAQERADRVYFDTVDRHTGPLSLPVPEADPGNGKNGGS